MSFRTRAVLALSLMLWLIVPAFAQTKPTEGLIDVLKETQGLSHFANMIEVMGLSDRYNNTDVFYTVFALEDDSADALLKDLGYEDLAALNDNDKLTLSVILTYHFLPGAYTQATFDAIQKTADAPIPLASALTGTTLTYDSGKIDDIANMTQADIPGSNGYIHIVDHYLVPTKEAFEKSVDIITSDTDLTKDQSDQATLAENLKGADDFSMITEAFEKTGLIDDLDKQGPYTLFVMPDNVFKKVLADANVTWDELLADEDGLTQLLMYHVLSGQYSLASLQEYNDAYAGTMLAHTVVGFKVDKDGKVSVNDLSLSVTDVVASNGIIHVIDGVLLPPSTDK